MGCEGERRLVKETEVTSNDRRLEERECVCKEKCVLGLEERKVIKDFGLFWVFGQKCW